MEMTMTYGDLPRRDQFETLFAKYASNGWFSFGNDERVGTDKLSSEQLWKHLVGAVWEWERFNDEKAGAWASSVLSCLGIEWV